MSSKEGSILPNIKLQSTEGGEVDLPFDLKGSYAIIYFYPKDDTPGCTKQACNYRDNLHSFDNENVKVFGVSLDDIESHNSFKTKFDLNFPLLVDSEHRLSEALGVYGDQEWKGKTFKGLSRDTFLVAPDGKIIKEWRGVSPVHTVKQTLEEVQRIKANNA